jgi:hypothetical protein
MHKIMIEKAINERRGMVINPRYSMYLVVQETPRLHGARSSGIIL